MGKIYKKRKPWSHKGDFGYVLIIGGSKLYSGSPILNALAALRSGADLTTIVAPQRAADVAASYSPDLIALPLEGDFLKTSHVNEIKDIAEKFDCLIIGGGLGCELETKKAVVRIVSEIKMAMVIDADAIKLLSDSHNVIQGKKIILTPNTPEFEKLTGKEISNKMSARKNQVKELAKKLNLVILLKGHRDVVSDGKKTSVIRSGTSFMTKGGFGDTLAGIVGSLVAQGIKPISAVKKAAKINGKAGELASDKYSSGLLASDILEYIPKVIYKKY